jgi:hypothetical protein
MDAWWRTWDCRDRLMQRIRLMRLHRLLFSSACLALLASCGSLGPTTDTGSPNLVIISPVNGATVPRNVLIEAQASDDVGVDKVRFLVDGVLLAEVLSPPYRVTWNTGGLASGSVHTIHVEATDFSKNLSAQEVTVTIGSAQGAP